MVVRVDLRNLLRGWFARVEFPRRGKRNHAVGGRMRRIAMVLGMVSVLVIGACEAADMPDVSSQASAIEDPAPPEGDNAIRDDDPHLPGSCTNPVACGTTTGTDPMGQGGGSGTPQPVWYCTGCTCARNPITCESCVRRCIHSRDLCILNGGGGGCGTAGDCNTACDADGLVCVCPTQPH